MSNTTYTFRGIGYTTIDEAEDAARAELGWDDIVTTERFTVDTETEAVACFPSEEVMDADPDAESAPRIVITYA